MRCCAKKYKSPYKNLPFEKGCVVVGCYKEKNALEVKLEKIN